MADSKVSELTAASSAAPSDFLYIVQSGASKKISVGNFLSNTANITLTGKVTIGDTPQTLTTAGVISLTTPITHLSANASGGTLTLDAGTSGQIKVIVMVATTGGSFTITDNIAGGGTVTFEQVGDTAQLLFTNNKWYVIGGTAAVA